MLTELSSPASLISCWSINSQNNNDRSIISDPDINQSMDGDKGETTISQINNRKNSNKFLNFHIDVHFDRVDTKYAHIWNRNVL